jgi:hypothetical protein
MKTLILIALLGAAPKIQQTDLVIHYNPATPQGVAVKQQLTTDLVSVCNKWPKRERLMGFNAVLEHEYARRRVHKYFRVKFQESSDRMSFRIGAGNQITVPDHVGPDPREYPGYIQFFDYVVDVHHRAYFDDLRLAENKRIWKRWYVMRNAKYATFTFNLLEKKYEQYWDEYEFGLGEAFFKDGKFYSAESLGWREPDPPQLLPIITPQLCPLNPRWSLPK